jgi:hypothetical protein
MRAGGVPLVMDLKPAIAGLTPASSTPREPPANTVTYGVHQLHSYHTLPPLLPLPGDLLKPGGFEGWRAELQHNK